MSAADRVLITGATGFIGAAILHQALSSDAETRWVALIRGLNEDHARSRLATRLSRFVGLDEAKTLVARVDVIPGSLDEVPDLAGQLDDVTHIVHLAADTSFSSSSENWKINFDGTLKLADLASKLPRLRRFLHVGTATICGASPGKLVQENNYPRAGIPHLVEYTRAKAAAEFVLRERYRHLPIIVARPSIVAGHTTLGVRPSSSIFWFVRFAESVGLVPGSEACSIDIVPVDWTAQTLLGLLFKDNLSHQTYHVSAGITSRRTWQEIAQAFAELRGEARAKQLETFSPERLDILRTRMEQHHAYRGSSAKLILRAAQRYYRFCQLDVTFDNSRLLAEGFQPPPPLTSYLDICLSNPPGLSILEEFMDDAEMFDTAPGNSSQSTVEVLSRINQFQTSKNRPQ